MNDVIAGFIHALPEKLLKVVDESKGLQDMIISLLPLKEETPCQSQTWSTCTEQVYIKGRKNQVVYSALDFDGRVRTIPEAEEFIANLTTGLTLVTAVDFAEGRASFKELHTCIVTAGGRIIPHYVDMAQEVHDDSSISRVLVRCNENRKANKILVFVEYCDESGSEVFKELLERLLLDEMHVLTLVDKKHNADIALILNDILISFKQVRYLLEPNCLYNTSCINYSTGIGEEEINKLKKRQQDANCVQLPK
jgi:hypothetical protein